MARLICRIALTIALLSGLLSAWNLWEAHNMHDAGAMGPGITGMIQGCVAVIALLISGIAAWLAGP